MAKKKEPESLADVLHRISAEGPIGDGGEIKRRADVVLFNIYSEEFTRAARMAEDQGVHPETRQVSAELALNLHQLGQALGRETRANLKPLSEVPNV